MNIDSRLEQYENINQYLQVLLEIGLSWPVVSALCRYSAQHDPTGQISLKLCGEDRNMFLVFFPYFGEYAFSFVKGTVFREDPKVVIATGFLHGDSVKRGTNEDIAMLNSRIVPVIDFIMTHKEGYMASSYIIDNVARVLGFGGNVRAEINTYTGSVTLKNTINNRLTMIDHIYNALTVDRLMPYKHNLEEALCH